MLCPASVVCAEMLMLWYGMLAMLSPGNICPGMLWLFGGGGSGSDLGCGALRRGIVRSLSRFFALSVGWLPVGGSTNGVAGSGWICKPAAVIDGIFELRSRLITARIAASVG